MSPTAEENAWKMNFKGSTPRCLPSLFIILNLTFLLVLALSGCASWQHPAGYGQNILDEDEEECKTYSKKYALTDVKVLRVGMVRPTAVLSSEQRIDKRKYKQLFNECMHGKGWYKAGEAPTNANQDTRLISKEQSDLLSRVKNYDPETRHKKAVRVSGDYVGMYTVQFLNAQPYQNKSVISLIQRDNNIYGNAILESGGQYKLEGTIKGNKLNIEALSRSCNDSVIIKGSYDNGTITLTGTGEAFSDCQGFVGPYSLYGVFEIRK